MSLGDIMSKNNFIYKSNDGVTNINAVKWNIDSPKAVIQIAHGVTEYIDRYDEFANYLNEKGFVVVGNDHIGHGKFLKKKDQCILVKKVVGIML